jgi:hypothetical protein
VFVFVGLGVFVFVGLGVLVFVGLVVAVAFGFAVGVTLAVLLLTVTFNGLGRSVPLTEM